MKTEPLLMRIASFLVGIAVFVAIIVLSLIMGTMTAFFYE